MDGNVIEYLSKLLNKEVHGSSEIILSSAQRARLHAWLKKNKVSFNEEILYKRFTVTGLLHRGVSNEVSQEKFAVGGPSIFLGDGYSSGIGIDIQRVDELFPSQLQTDPKLDAELTSIFTMSELSYAQSRVNAIETLTGIFAVKEAIQKCSDKKLNYLDIQVFYSPQGRARVPGYDVSISHSGGFAIAVALPNLRSDLEPMEMNNLPESESDISHMENKSKFRPMYALFFLLIMIIFFFKFFG